jgi:phage terminase large subunit-like protein
MQAGRSLVPDLPLDMVEAKRAVAIFNKLRLPDVPGRPSLREGAGEWQRDIVRAVFGSLDVHNHRQVPEVFAMVPKKSSKTTGGAAIMMTALLVNKRPRAEFILVGPTQEISDLAFQQASGMIDADADLKRMFRVQEHLKTIIDERNKSKLKIKTFDLDVMTGSKPAGVLCDELHQMAGKSFASRVLRQIRGGLIANPEGFLIFITTQSDEPPAGVFKAELKHARAIRDGMIKDARMLPVIYEFSEEQQHSGAWKNPENWPQVLPNLNKPVTIDRLISEFSEAREKGDEEVRGLGKPASQCADRYCDT